MTEALNRWQLAEQLADALPGESPAIVSRMATILWRKGVRGVGEIGGYDVNDAIGWYGVGVKMVPLLKRLGMVGELPCEERGEPTERRKLECPICGSAMHVGARARVSVQWEYERDATRDGRPLHGVVNDLVGRSSMVCRDCAARLSSEARIEIPKEALYVDGKR